MTEKQKKSTPGEAATRALKNKSSITIESPGVTDITKSGAKVPAQNARKKEIGSEEALNRPTHTLSHVMATHTFVDTRPTDEGENQ